MELHQALFSTAALLVALAAIVGLTADTARHQSDVENQRSLALLIIFLAALVAVVGVWVQVF